MPKNGLKWLVMALKSSRLHCRKITCLCHDKHRRPFECIQSHSVWLYHYYLTYDLYTLLWAVYWSSLCPNGIFQPFFWGGGGGGGGAVAQCYSAWLETEGPRVRASPASLRCSPWARNIYPSLELVQPRKTRPYITERLLIGRKESNQAVKINFFSWFGHEPFCNRVNSINNPESLYLCKVQILLNLKEIHNALCKVIVSFREVVICCISGRCWLTKGLECPTESPTERSESKIRE